MTLCRWDHKDELVDDGAVRAVSVKDFIRSEAADSRLFIDALNTQFSDREMVRELGTLDSVYATLREAACS